ncbi:MAG: glycosyltransferase family 2 protein [Gammaproteobacteria bacterium]|nr:glycosyltransferase family 2 protein [Gammaproteobacteria bacterium]
MTPLDIIIPVFNEPSETVAQSVLDALKGFGRRRGIRIIVVDDGSRPAVDRQLLPEDSRVELIRHEKNRGYGAALKTGIRHGDAPHIAISDADGSYPLEVLPSLAAALEEGKDMAVGVRAPDSPGIPLARRFPKRVLNGFASWLAASPIRDLNSGLRVFRRDLVEHFWHLLPRGFSFTSTLTMGSLLGGFRVTETDVDYAPRIGRSAIRPVRDTIRFFRTVMRLGLLFAPMRVFGPVAGVLIGIGMLKGLVRDYFLLGYVGNLAVILMIAGLQVFLMGLLAEVVVLSRGLKQRNH